MTSLWISVQMAKVKSGMASLDVAIGALIYLLIWSLTFMFTCVLADAQNEGRVLRTRRADMFKSLRAHREEMI